MKFGVREICDVVLRAKSYQTLGKAKFYKDEPVLYFDTLKTSSLEGASTTVYATGGRGNAQLIAWEGERTLTFTMEDALISEKSFSILSGAGLLDVTEEKPIYVHQTSQVEVKQTNTIVIEDELACWNHFPEKNDNEYYHRAADIFVMVLDNGEVDSEPCIPVEVKHENGNTILTCYSHEGILPQDTIVLVDYYVKRTGGAQVIEITADKFGGNYYLEASTLFRREKDGVDMPAEFIIPNCKVQSNFTFSMASSGDPSTFTFTMDAFPDYIKFDQTHKVLAAIYVINDESGETESTREKCSEKVTTYESENADIEVKFEDNTSTAAAIDVTGTVEGQAFDAELYNANNELDGVQGAQMIINLPVENDSIQYELKTTNPVNKKYPNDNRIDVTTGVKTQTVTGADLQDGLAVLLSNVDYDVEKKAGPDITIEVQKINGDFHKTYTIKNNIEFSEAATASTFSTRRNVTRVED